MKTILFIILITLLAVLWILGGKQPSLPVEIPIERETINKYVVEDVCQKYNCDDAK